MQQNKSLSSFPLRLPDQVRELAKSLAIKNRRSLNAELGLLIEEGLKSREVKLKQIGQA